jgi:hypothetical protein
LTTRAAAALIAGRATVPRRETPIYASTLHRRDRAWGTRRRATAWSVLRAGVLVAMVTVVTLLVLAERVL